MKAQEAKTEEIKTKAKENKIYRGNRSNGDYWRRKKRTTQNAPQKKDR
jgi:ATP-dependent RNA helicase RhlE